MVWGLGGTAMADLSYTIVDNYWGGAPSPNTVKNADVIGDKNKFDIASITVFTDDQYKLGGVTIKSKYFLAENYKNLLKKNITMGDLFISDDGWSPVGTAANHWASDTGKVSGTTDWEFVIVTEKPTADNYSKDTLYNTWYYYTSDGEIVYSTAPSSQTAWYRADQEVSFKTFIDDENNDENNHPSGKWSFTTQQENGVWWAYMTIKDWNLYKLFKDNWNNLAVSYTMSCANDSAQGAVPVPPSLLLLGTGLIGMVGFRKKSKGGES